ncbi:helix-turn-helix domain-containing protein [Vagococcus elongatus]|uniref:HTH cro/C1-type domain-containing protein n=1 Tax=Vagococcus elongatus TaxID=180344 RepID=A0A430AX58_9ENTE|nr:helix-turn-helix transcriptional regulator [Vagococcus elongatus]RSU12633.1 hypothetical protein CBF29_05760 [Vagococcus elongatus]
MTEIKLGKIVQRCRKEKNMTQEELAIALGVSKSAVSKWENHQTMPDVLLLPALASLFKISIDELLGYSPQLTQEETRQWYKHFSDEFTRKNFSEVKQEIDAMLGKYSVCYSFQLQMVILLFNHLNLAGDATDRNSLLEELLQLSETIKKETSQPNLAKQANVIQAIIYSLLDKNEMVMVLLGKEVNLYLAENQVLANAYFRSGDLKKAGEILQIEIYQNLFALVSNSSHYLSLLETPEKVNETIKRIKQITAAYQIKELSPYTYLTFLFSSFIQLLTLDEREDALEAMTEIIEILKMSPAIELQGDDYFDQVVFWLDKQTDLGNTIPRDKSLVKASILEFFTSQPLIEEKLGRDSTYQKLFQQLMKLTGS